jgi:TonB family protein
MKGTILAALLLACGAAQASDWQELGSSEKGTVFVDFESVHLAHGIGRVWWKVVPKTPLKGPDGHRLITYMVIRSEFDCNRETVTYEAMTLYLDNKDQVTAGPGDLADHILKPVEPDTTDDVVMKYVCASKPASQADSPTSYTDDPPSPKSVPAVVAATPIKTIRMPSCGEDYYPAQAIRLNQQGSVVVKLCVGVNNKIDGPVEVVTSSGFPLLDEAAGKCVGAGSYKAGVVNGAPARTCKEISVSFKPLEGR